METPIFSMDNWWRWLIIFIIIIAAGCFFRVLAKSLFAKTKADNHGGDAEIRSSLGDVPFAEYKRNHTDIASMDSSTNTSTIASIVIDAAANL